jgi:uncharacterized membrane protein
MGMITLSWLLIVTVLAAALSMFDGIRRVRGNRTNSILAIAELVFAVLMLISIFIAFPAPLGTFVFAVALEVVLILLLVLRGTRGSGFTTLTLIALILNTVVVLIAAGWLSIPGLG